MKKVNQLLTGQAVALSLFMSCSLIGRTQSNEVLDQNNVSAIVSDGGLFFTNASASSAGYEIPKGSGLNALYVMGFWFGSIDINGQVKLSAQTYDIAEDLFLGPLTADGLATPPSPGAWPQGLFPITRAEINDHIANYMNAGYVTPPSIANWPAHGDIAQGFDYYLAPFVDANGNGMYDPNLGDFPCVKGDKAVYTIMNDKGDVHGSGGDPLGIEVHFMVYQYETSDAINNTTFVNTKVINRSTATHEDFRVATFIDPDLGFYGDDYLGCDSTRNLMFAYNGDNFDEDNSGTNGYGAAPPAIGIMSLSNDLSKGISLDGGTQPFLTLNTPLSYWHRMNGRDNNGAPLLQYGYNTPANFFFNGNPMTFTGETEVEVGNAPGDRKLITVIASNSLVPGEIKEYDHAVIYNRGVDNLASANGLLAVADTVQTFFDADPSICEFLTAFVEESPLNLTSVYPNPSGGSFVVKFGHTVANGNLSLHDLSGRLLFEEEINGDEVQVNVVQPAGIYLLNFSENGRLSTLKVVIE